MKRTMITWMMAGMLLATTAASGDETETDATEAAGDESGGNAEVDEFCATAEDVAAELKKVMADPTSGDVAALSAQASELSTQGATLSASITDAAEAQRISDCLSVITAAMTGA